MECIGFMLYRLNFFYYHKNISLEVNNVPERRY